MTQVAEKKIINELSDLKKDIGEIKQAFHFFIDEDFWLYDPKVKKYLQKRFKQAEKGYRSGKVQPIEKLWAKLGV